MTHEVNVEITLTHSAQQDNKSWSTWRFSLTDISGKIQSSNIPSIKVESTEPSSIISNSEISFAVADITRSLDSQQPYYYPQLLRSPPSRLTSPILSLAADLTSNRHCWLWDVSFFTWLAVLEGSRPNVVRRADKTEHPVAIVLYASPSLYCTPQPMQALESHKKNFPSFLNNLFLVHRQKWLDLVCATSKKVKAKSARKPSCPNGTRRARVIFPSRSFHEKLKKSRCP